MTPRRAASATIDTISPPDGQPLYRRIQQVMRRRIAQGDWAAGLPLPSRVQLCEEFGTTRVTLDKAVHELVREGLLRSARGSGTFIAVAGGTGGGAECPVGARTLRVGLLLGRAAPGAVTDAPGIEDHYFGPLFQGIRDAVAGQPVEMVHAHHTQADYAGFYRENGLDGVLLVTPLLGDLPLLHALARAGVPCVAVGVSSHAPADAALAVVDADNRQGACDAVRHLLDLGHRRIGLVNLATAQANHHDRLEGYRLALTGAGVSVGLGDLLLYPTHESERLDERIGAWVSQAVGGPPTAVLASDYQMALATVRVLRRSGLRVPDDVSVVGFDDPFSAEHLTPPLTTVRQPVYQIGRRAAQRLLDALRAGEMPRGAEILPTRLIVRESTRSPQSARPPQ